ncbi:unnamed protein product [marine sediment metagenome]|uniref:Uncharacterized protein n=1 Tax=marine sediment metagenome TaxID=412755 RepID=X1AGP9_9ZZZZ
MAKAKLNLSIDTDLLELAKNSDLNLSAEFEDWVKIRLVRHHLNNGDVVDYGVERAKLKQELALLESKEELAKKQEFKMKEEQMIIDDVINNVKEFHPKGISVQELTNRSHGLIYLLKRKLRKSVTEKEALKMLIDGGVKLIEDESK